jgi:branched-chain amino acid transport system permease protein
VTRQAETGQSEAIAVEAAPANTGTRNLLSGFYRTRYSTIAKVVFVLILLIWPLAYKNLYYMSIMTTAGLFAMLTIAVGLILGQAGQLSFGHSAFYGMGAYVAALLSLKLHVPTLASLAIAAVFPGIIALIIGRPVLKLRYFYLALATIGLGQIFMVLLIQMPSVTRGINGLNGIPALSIFGWKVGSLLRQYYVIWIPALVILLLVQRGLKYRLGRSLRALATSEIASSTLGIRTANWKLLAFVANAVICGLAGGLFAFITGSIAPTSFTFNVAILPIVMALVGGSATIWGGVLGAIIMTFLLNYFTGIQQYSGVAYSVIMILLLLFLPMGILGLRPSTWSWARQLVRKESLRETAEVVPQANAMAVEALTDPSPVSTAQAVFSTGGGGATSGLLQRELASRKTDGRGKVLLSIDGVSVLFGGLKAVSEVSCSTPSAGSKS